jgi:hypothetical protein
MLSTEIGFCNSAEVKIFLKLVFTSADFLKFPEFRVQNSAKYRGIPNKILHRIPKEIQIHVLIHIHIPIGGRPTR